MNEPPYLTSVWTVEDGVMLEHSSGDVFVCGDVRSGEEYNPGRYHCTRNHAIAWLWTLEGKQVWYPEGYGWTRVVGMEHDR